MPPKKRASTQKRKADDDDTENNVKKTKANDVNVDEISVKEEEIPIKSEVAESQPMASNDTVRAKLKIGSWNINGIRAWVEHDGMEFVKKEDFDIFCCQETKCDKTKIPVKAEIPGYHSYWLSGDKDGYSGVGLLSKIKPKAVTYGIDDKKFDSEGRVITAEYDTFFLVNSYIPNSSRGLVRLPFRLEWEAAFLKYLKGLDAQKPVIWCGDLNVAHQRIDIRNPDTNKKSAGFTQSERDSFTKVLSSGFIDSFRQLYPDKEHAYTFWSYFNGARDKNIGWRLDYFVLSERLNKNLLESTMRTSQKGSDHCPIVLEINI